MGSYRRGSPTIGVLTGWQAYAGVIDSFLEHVMRGIQAAASARGCNLLLACGAGTATTFDQYQLGWPVVDPRVDFLPVGPWNCDGLIFVPPFSVQTCEKYAQELERQGVPVVFAGLQGIGPGVGVDNAMGIREAVQHLYEHGHRQIAFIAGFDSDLQGDSGSRFQAYREALVEVGLPFDPDLTLYGYHEFQQGQEAMRLLLTRGRPFSAVMTSNDLTAIGALEALHQAGRMVPRDVALIGFDNRIETRAQVPPLTTIHFPMFELGYQSVEMVLDRLDGKVSPGEIRKIPTHLVIRESCGCLPGEAGKNHHPTRSEQEIAGIIQTETHRMMPDEVLLLAKQFVEAYHNSLSSGKAQVFLSAFQAILDQVSDSQNDLFIWQHAITALRDHLDAPAKPGLQPMEAANMLDRARRMTSEAARAQAARQFIRQSQVSEQLKIMTNRFFAARDEDEIFQILHQLLPAIGIGQNAVLYFQPQDGDPYALSALQSPHAVHAKGALFNTYQFPPPDLFSNSPFFHFALLPLSIGQVRTGYVALQAGSLEPMADIVCQLASSLYAIHLRQEAIEGQRMAEEANQLKSRFLSMVSHELRAPLNLISGLSDLLIKSKNTGDLSNFSWEDLERIYASAQHLDGLIQDVLDLSLSDVKQLKLTCEPLSIKDVLDPVIFICKSLIHDKSLTWRYEIEEALPTVWGDRTRLRQVAWNLLHNAIKFTEQGEVALRAFLDEQGRVAVSVSDTGLGIPMGEQEIIFQEFRQSARTASRGYGGMGLGLAICKRLVELHGGEITVCSSECKDTGAVFTFTLPPMSEPPVYPPAQPKTAQTSRVLLLVKNPQSSEVLKGYLEEKGHQVEQYTIRPDSEWLSWLLNFNPDVVILDLEITAQRGWELLKILSENPAAQDIPVLFYNVSSDGQSGSFLELDYLSKPIKSSVLSEMLRHYQIMTPPAAPMILVVDDDAPTVEFHTRLILSQFPTARVRPAYHGRQALEIIRQETPVLVLLDLMMPEMDGFEVLREMREDKHSRDIPVIVITSQSLNQHDIARLNQGMVSILTKNILSQEETLQHISAFLQNRYKRSAEAQQIVLNAMAFIHGHYKEAISRSDIAASIGLSERHLDRCFQQYLGISPIRYLNRYRVNQARNLLETQKIGITAVAMAVGFSSSGYFARVFRDETGVSPRAYLQNKKG